MDIIGMDRRSLPVECDANGLPAQSFTVMGRDGRLDFKVVLVFKGPDKAVAAYRGSGADSWVAAHGDKLSLQEAVAHFPHLVAWLEGNGCWYDQ